MQTCSKSKIWPKINNAKENGHFENKSVPQNALLLIAGFDLFFLGTADVLPQRAGRFCFFLIFFFQLSPSGSTSPPLLNPSLWCFQPSTALNCRVHTQFVFSLSSDRTKSAEKNQTWCSCPNGISQQYGGHVMHFPSIIHKFVIHCQSWCLITFNHGRSPAERASKRDR